MDGFHSPGGETLCAIWHGICRHSLTEGYVTDTGTAELLENWLSKIRALATKENVPIPATTVLFLEIDQELGSCSYWFADHAHRSVFWLHDVDTDTAGLQDAYPDNHRRESHVIFTS